MDLRDAKALVGAIRSKKEFMPNPKQEALLKWVEDGIRNGKKQFIGYEASGLQGIYRLAYERI